MGEQGEVEGQTPTVMQRQRRSTPKPSLRRYSGAPWETFGPLELNAVGVERKRGGRTVYGENSSAPLVTTQKSGAANQDSRIILQEVTVGDTLLPSSSAVLFVGDE